MKLLYSLFIWIVLGLTVFAQAGVNQESQRVDVTESGPRCIVIATDMSGSMNTNDPLVKDPEGKLQAIRDDAQLTCLQLIRSLSTPYFIGVCKFSTTVDYGFPGGSADKVAPRDSLQVWSEFDLDWETLREELSTKRPIGSGGTRIDQAMEWAHRRIGLARRWRCPEAPGMLVILSDGDPGSAYHEIRNGGPILSAADKLAKAGIRVYPIIINTASYRPGRVPLGLDAQGKAAEELMEQVAYKTGGKAYRIRADFGLLDIFLEILEISIDPVNPGIFPVSRHHRSVILIGPKVQAVHINPFNDQEHTLSVSEGLDKTTGIRSKVIPLARWDVTILRRPDDSKCLDRFWCGNWHPQTADRQGNYEGRVYLVPDFLLQTNVMPKTPWTLERAKIRSRLVKRPEEFGESDTAVPPLPGTGLLLKFILTNEDREQSIKVAHWDGANQAYECDSFHFQKAGRYELTCECSDHVNGKEIPLGRFSSHFTVTPCPVSLVFRVIKTNKSVKEIPYGRAKKVPPLQGGQKLNAQLKVVDNTVQSNNVVAFLHLKDVKPAQLQFRRERDNTLTTETFSLPETDTHLAGHAQVTFHTSEGKRQIPLAFNLPLRPAERRLESQFSDSRRALWIGEYHQQSVTLSVLPIFDNETRQEVAASFPTVLSGATLKVIGGTDGHQTPVPVRCFQVGSAQALEPGSHRVSANYRLESQTPLPPGTAVEIDLGPIVEDLRLEKKRYDLVDPAKNNLFRWYVFQNMRDSSTLGVVSEINAGELTWFLTNWRGDQGISQVSFEIVNTDAPQQKPSLHVGLPVTESIARAQAKSTMDGLSLYQNYDVITRVKLRPAEAEHDTQIRLYAGRFTVQELLPKLMQLTVGETSGEDIIGFALEPKEVPLKAVFTNYRETNPEHRNMIEDFKESCRLALINENGTEEKFSTSIEWTKAERGNLAQGDQDPYRLMGRAVLIPKLIGRNSIQLSGQMLIRDKHGTSQSIQSTNAGFFARKPRYHLVVSQDQGDRMKTLYDSDHIVAGQKPKKPIDTPYSTKLHVMFEVAPTLQISSKVSQDIDLHILRRDGTETLSERQLGQTCRLTHDKRSFNLKLNPLEEEGEYRLQVTSKNSEPNLPNINLITPVLIRMTQTIPALEIVAPPNILTTYMRQIPFQYEMPIPPGLTFNQFQFQLPVMDDHWFDGISFEKSSTNTRVLVLRSPNCLNERPGQIASGRIRFRVKWSNGTETTWRSERSIRIVKPWMQGVRFFNLARGKTSLPKAQAPIHIKVPIQLRTEPVFRSAAELEGWWLRKETKVYVKCLSKGDLKDNKLTPRFLNELTNYDLDQQTKSELEVFPLKMNESGVNILETACPRTPFWGMPRGGSEEPYVIFAVANYESKKDVRYITVTVHNATNSLPHLVSEWSQPYVFNIKIPLIIPYVWWLIVLPVYCLVVALLKLGVPSPEKLRLHIQLGKCEATVEPAADNRKMARILETSLNAELNKKQAQSSWNIVPKNKPWSHLLRFLQLFLYWLFVPRRRALIYIWPNQRPNLTGVQDNRLYIWTGPINRQGRISYNGFKNESLPETGKSKHLGLDIKVKINGSIKHMPIPMEIRRVKETKQQTRISSIQNQSNTSKPLLGRKI